MTEILNRWLEGESLDELGADEQALRVELAALQERVREMDAAGEAAVNQRNAMAETARKLNLLLGAYGEQAEKVSRCFGEWPEGDAEPLSCGCLPSRVHFFRGYLCGKGSQATRQQRSLDALANVVRLRSTHDGGGEA